MGWFSVGNVPGPTAVEPLRVQRTSSLKSDGFKDDFSFDSHGDTVGELGDFILGPSLSASLAQV